MFGKGNDFVAKITYKRDRPLHGRPHRRLPQLPEPADRGHGGHDRHRHRREAARVRVLHAQGSQPHLLRADEGPRSPRHLGHRPPGGRPRRDLEGAVRDRRRGRRHRDRAPGDPASRPAADRAARPAAPAGVLRRPRPGHDLDDRLPALAARSTLSETQRTQLTVLAGGTTLREIARGIVGALDPDRQLERAARADTGRAEPSVDEIARCVEGAPRRGGGPARDESRAPRADRRGPAHIRAGDRRDLGRHRARAPATRPTRPTAHARRSSPGSASARSTATRSPRSSSSTPAPTPVG